MLATIFFVFCMSSGDSQCVQVNPLHEQIEFFDCATRGEIYLKQWLQEAGPGYELRFENADHYKWRCRQGASDKPI